MLPALSVMRVYTVWLPSGPIALTAPITIPASVALIGISHKAILNFSGFAGAAIVLSANSVIQDFTLNHTDGIWFDASAGGAKVLRIHGEAQKATVGVTTARQAEEIWRLLKLNASGYVLMFTLDFDFSGATDTATWHKHTTWPAGFDSTSDSTAQMAMTSDGANLYLSRNNTIWQCTNVAAIRATPATTPTWATIAQVGDSVAGGTIERVGEESGSNPLGAIETWNTLLIATAQVLIGASRYRVYGEYDGAAWTWYPIQANLTGLGRPTYRRANYRQAQADAAIQKQPVYNEVGSILTTFAAWGGGNAQSVLMWRNEIGGAAYTGTRMSPTGNMSVNLADDGMQLYDTGYNGNHFISLRGALGAPSPGAPPA